MANNYWGRSMLETLKEMYGETELIRNYKAGKLSQLEIELCKPEIEFHEKFANPLKDLVFNENPFLKMIKK